MTIRLNKVTRDLNVGITTAVEFLQKKGFTVEANPNTKITDEQFELLKKEFSTDKDLKIKSERFSQERQNKERKKESVAIDGYDSEVPDKTKSEEIKTVIPEEARPKFKPVGKIDLDKLNHRPSKEKEPAQQKKAEEPKVETAPEVKVEAAPQVKPEVKPEVKAEVKSEVKPVVKPEAEQEPQHPVKPQPEMSAEEKEHHQAAAEVNPVSAKKEEPMEEKKIEEPTKEVMEEKKEDEVFKIRQTEFVSKINVIGQIDLAALNQTTRPKKKSKEEKKKEREEKEKMRMDQRKQMKEAIIKEIRREDSKLKDRDKDGEGNGKKKQRVRINKEKVDINNASNFQRGDRNKGAAQQNQQGGKKGKDRFKKPVLKQEVSEEDVAKQVKETLARLTSKGKNKGAKYRKEKREQAADRMQELENQEMAESKILKLTEFVTANELANMMDVSVTQVIAT